MKILVVEDQRYTLENLLVAIKRLVPKYFKVNIEGNDIDVARWYLKAEELIQRNVYDFVLLDHRMPLNDLGFDDIDEPTRGVFSQALDEAQDMGIGGYNLIPLIKKNSPQTIIIGTSSLKKEVAKFPKPDYIIDKTDLRGELETVFSKIVSAK